MTAVRLALAEWSTCLRDLPPPPPGLKRSWELDRVTTYIRDGFGWGPKTLYRGDGTYKWCGAFAAWCHPDLPVELRQAMASTWRLHSLGLKTPGVLVPFGAARPGDLVCVGQGDYGSHVTLVVGWGDERRSELVTVSGNGEGTLGDGSWGEGVVLRCYPRTSLRAAYRLA